MDLGFNLKLARSLEQQFQIFNSRPERQVDKPEHEPASERVTANVFWGLVVVLSRIWMRAPRHNVTEMALRFMFILPMQPHWSPKDKSPVNSKSLHLTVTDISP